MTDPSNATSDSHLLSLLPGLVYRCLNDAEWTMLELSGAVETITGYQSQELLAGSAVCYADIIHEDDRDYVTSAVEQGVAAKTGYYIDYRIRTKSNEILHVWEHGHGIYDDKGELIELVGYIYNATSNVQKLERQKRMRDAAVALTRDPHLARGDFEIFARHAVKMCCEVLEVSSADIWLFDDGKTQLTMTTYYNLAENQYRTGLSHRADQSPVYFNEVIKNKVIDAFDAQSDPRTQEFNHFTLIPMNIKSILHCAIRQAGDVVGVLCFEQVATQRRWSDDEITFAGDVADQVAHALSNREIRNAENRLLEEQASSEAKSHFLSIMSHEIRTPLNGVLGVADLLGMTKLDQKQMEYVSLIEESGKLLLKIIGDILDVTKIDSGQLDIRVQPTDVRSLCSDCIEVVRPQLNAKELSLEFTVSDAVPELCELDAIRVQQVLLNLLSNAIKFTARGQVLLKAEITSRSRGDYLGLTVLDTGVGISDDLAKEIFKPFTQDRMQNMNDSLKGAGLGLPICRGLVALMNGEIELQSEEGKGSVFRVLLPLKAVANHEASEVKSLPSGEFSQLRVLVAEDNTVNQKVVEGMLKMFSVVPDICSDGKQAVDQVIAANDPYDLILMDCEMPVMDGFEAVEKIRELEPPRGTAFIAALTAHALEEYRERAERVGMNEYLTKPLQRDRLLQLLETLPGSAGD
ncbi:MAG: ATP-binding protein [Cellvibrionaceae bacterium]